MLLRNVDDPLSRKGDKSYFNADSGTPISEFLDEYEPRLREAETADGNFNFITCNHDTARVAPRLSQREIALAYCTLFAMPGVPFLYYGDEIGMRYRALPGKEGGYVRTGSRTPMQWGANDASGALHVSDSAETDIQNTPDASYTSDSAETDIHSTPKALHVSDSAESDTRAGDVTGGSYLPADPSADAPTVAAQQADAESLWHTVRSILHVKRECDALRSGATFHAIERDRVFVFERSTHLQKLIIAVNPSRDCKALQLPDGSYRTIFSIGENEISGTSLRLGLQSFAILEAE